MNKLFTKIAALSVGLAMAIGVGVAVGSGNKADRAKATGEEWASTTDNFMLVDSTSDLADGDKIIIVSSTKDHAMGAQNVSKKLRSCASITKSDNGQKVNADEDDTVAIITLVENGDYFNLFDGANYLYNSSYRTTGSKPSNKNQLESRAAVGTDGYADWTITVTDGVASIESKEVASAGKLMRYNYNNNDPRITCYVSGQDALQIYKKTDGPLDLAAPTNVTYNSSTQRITWDAVTGASGYQYTTDNGSNWASVSNPSDRYHNVSSWTDGTNYSVKIRATGDGTTYAETGAASSACDFEKVATPTYSSVTVTAGSLTGDTKGSAYIQCSALVNGTGAISQDVTWSISSNSTFSADTEIAGKATINQSGKVVFLDNVTNYYVWALAADGSTKGSITVTASGLVGEKGSEENPYTVAEAVEIASALASGANNGKIVFVRGYVSGTVTDMTYGARFTLTDGTNEILAYSIAGAQGGNSGSAGYIEEGYIVVVGGAIINHATSGYEVGYASSTLTSSLSSVTVPNYTVSFNANGGSGTMSPVANQHGRYTLPDSSFTAPASSFFAGWKAENAGDTIAKDAKSALLTGDVTFYAQWGAIKTISVNVDNGTYEGDSTIVEGGNATVTISASEGYKLPTSVTVNGATSSYNSSTGVISLSNPTSNVTISATCPALATYTISVTASHCTYSGDESIQEKGQATVTFVADEGYVLPTLTNVTVSGATKVSFTNGALVINNPTTNVTISVTAASYDNTFNIVSGGQYKIHHTKKDTTDVYYLKSNGASSAPSATKNTWEATIFTFTLIGDDTFEIKNGSDYLYTTNDNNGVRVGSTVQSWKLKTGTTGKSGAYELQNQSYTSRYLSLYSTNDFRTYGNTATNRTENTDLTYFDAGVFAQDIVNATDAVCSKGYNNQKSDFTTNWTTLTNRYSFLSASEKALLVNATYTRDGYDVTETGTTTKTVAEGVARHDYVVAKYALDNILTGRVIPPLGRIDISAVNNETTNVATAIIVIASLTLLGVGGYFFIRKKKEQ